MRTPIYADNIVAKPGQQGLGTPLKLAYGRNKTFFVRAEAPAGGGGGTVTVQFLGSNAVLPVVLGDFAPIGTPIELTVPAGNTISGGLEDASPWVWVCAYITSTGTGTQFEVKVGA